MKTSKMFKRVLCTLLCICMLMGTLIALASCETTEPEAPVDEGTKKEDQVTVVRAIKAMDIGDKLERANLEEITVDKSQVPEGAVNTISEIVNKFLKTPLVAGDYIFEEKVAPSLQFLKENSQGALHPDYVLVTKYTDSVTGDFTEAIQKAIDENPNKTIYFPDGNYRVTAPIQTSADPAKAVSLRFSNYAVVSAGGKAEDWGDGKAVFELGAKDSAMGAKTSFIGGVVNASNIGTVQAIAVKGGNVLINNVSIKGAEIGINIAEGARSDVDSCVVIGNAQHSSIGVLVQSEENTLTNMRICRINIGVKLTGGNNVMRNLHPLFVLEDERWSTGFYDISSGNFYDVCYSDQFAIGFYMGENTKSVYNGCFAYWYRGIKDKLTGKDGQQYGFYAAEAFNSIIRDTRVTLKDGYGDPCDLTYLKVESGAVYDGNETGAERTPSTAGNGVVLYPRNSGHKNDEHAEGWAGFLKTDKLG